MGRQRKLGYSEAIEPFTPQGETPCNLSST